MFQFSRAERIVYRYSYYYQHPGGTLPPEKCFSKWFRVIFTQNPHPYSYNYGFDDPSEKKIEEVIHLLRTGRSCVPGTRRASSRPVSSHSRRLTNTNATPSHISRASYSLLYLRKSKCNRSSISSKALVDKKPSMKIE